VSSNKQNSINKPIVNILPNLCHSWRLGGDWSVSLQHFVHPSTSLLKANCTNEEGGPSLWLINLVLANIGISDYFVA